MFNLGISWILVGLIVLLLLTTGLFLIWEKIQYTWLDKICNLLVLSFPFQGMPSVLGNYANLRISQLVVLVGLSVFIILLIKKDQNLMQKKLNFWGWWVISFIFVIIPSWFFVQDYNRFVQYILGLSLVFGATFLLSNFAQNIPQKVIYLLWSMLLACVFAAYQFTTDMAGLTQYSFLRSHYTKKIFGIPRVHSFFLEPLLFAGALFFPIIFSFLALISRQRLFDLPSFIKNQFSKTWLHFLSTSYFINLSLSGIFLIFFILTFSKSAFLALAITLIPTIIFFIWKFRDWLTVKLFGLILIFFVLIITSLYLNTPSLQTSLLYISQNFYDSLLGTGSSALERNAFMDTGLTFLPDYIITGAGAGQYGQLGAFHLRYLGGQSGELIINNIYLELWLEYGIIALLFFLFLWLVLIRQNLQFLHKISDWQDSRVIVRLSLFLSVIAYLIQWWFFSPIYIMPIFILLGLLLNLHDSQPSKQE